MTDTINTYTSFKTKYPLGKWQIKITKIKITKEKRIKWAQAAKTQYPKKFPLIIERA
jgi:hypothetical protein